MNAINGRYKGSRQRQDQWRASIIALHGYLMDYKVFVICSLLFKFVWRSIQQKLISNRQLSPPSYMRCTYWPTHDTRYGQRLFKEWSVPFSIYMWMAVWSYIQFLVQSYIQFFEIYIFFLIWHIIKYFKYAYISF